MNTNRLDRYWITSEEKQEREPRATAWPIGARSRSELLEDIGDFLGEHPGATLAVATSLGVFLGWLIKRR